jgi:hypothetical protein
MTIRVYHRTNDAAAAKIDSGGFHDADNDGYPNGVWVSTYPFEGGFSKQRPSTGPIFLIELEGIPRERMFHDFEVIETGKPYREFIIPAALLNTFSRRRLTQDEAEDIRPEDIWNDYPYGEPGATWMRLQEDDDMQRDNLGHEFGE